MRREDIDRIIVENERRKSRNAAPFNPISGEGSVGPRFLIVRNGGRLWIPESMKVIPTLESMPEKRFERLRVLHDFPYWAAKYAYIKTKGGGDDSLFILNRPQRMLVERLEAIRNAGRPIRLLLLKARQWGGSTCIQLYMAWLQLMHELGLNSLIIAHQRTATDEIKDMFDRLIKQYPDGLLAGENEEADSAKGKVKKMEGVGGAGNTTRIPSRKCKIKAGSAERPDSCRGGDYNLVHCSEVGIWKSTPSKTPEDIVRSACAGVLLRPLTMIVFESTANGTGNFFHREYEAAKRGSSQFEALFISWFDIDQYSLQIPDLKAFAARLIAAKDSEGTDSDRRQPGKYLWWLWEKGATLEAIAWYVAERSKYSDHALMAAEYPSDDVEAFAHSGSRIFDRYKVEEMRKDCRPPKLKGEIDSPLRPLAGRYPDDDFRMKQLEEAQFTSGAGAWQIWKTPEYSAGYRYESRYVAVVDVGGRAEKSDWSVIAIFDRDPMIAGKGPEIVAQWRG
ncbi:MAG: terminase, partial [Muribaculaceae bacterium]|nr:terminase [Muribaculaceae bacterium]